MSGMDIRVGINSSHVYLGSKLGSRLGSRYSVMIQHAGTIIREVSDRKGHTTYYQTQIILIFVVIAF